MRLHIPTGLTAVLASYDQVLTALHCLGTETHRLVSDSFRARLEPAYRQLVALSDRYTLDKHEWNQALIYRNQELSSLRRLVRDTWLMLRRRDQREGRQGLLILLYQLPNLAPPHASAAVWLQHARNLVNGEVKALVAGHAPMAFPSAAELAQSLARTERAETEYQLLTLALKGAETDLRKQQRLATHLLRRLAARLRESQYDQKPVQVRNLLRCFGYRFTATPSDDAEALAELAQNAPQEAAQAPEVTATPILAESEPPSPDRTGWTETLRTWSLTPKLERLKRFALREAS